MSELFDYLDPEYTLDCFECKEDEYKVYCPYDDYIGPCYNCPEYDDSDDDKDFCKWIYVSDSDILMLDRKIKLNKLCKVNGIK